MDHLLALIQSDRTRELVREASERGLVAHSADAATGRRHGFYVPTEKLASFIRFIQARS